MPFILIKNYLKLMLRNKWILFFMIILPIIVITLLSNAFKDMMNTSYKVGQFRVGYRISQDSPYKDMLPELKAVCRENGVDLIEFPEEDINMLLGNKAAAAFVDITKTSYTIYQSEDNRAEAAVTESILSGFFYQVNSNMTLAAYGMEHGSQGTESFPAVQSVKEKLDTEPVASSTDYYGIVYIIYFAWCGMVSLVSVVSSERKGSVLKRMRVSRMSKVKYYLGKFVPCSLAIFIEACTAWVLSALLLDIHWGNIGASIMIVFLTSMAATAFGIIVFQLFGNAAVSIVAGFAIVWTEGFFGGIFESYMYSYLPEWLVKTSPIYYIDRTLVEFSTKGFSDYEGSCVVFLTAIIIVCGFLGTLLMGRKLEEQ